MTEAQQLVWNEERQAYMVGETETHFIDIVPMIFNHRVVLTPKSFPLVYDAGWCYPSLLAAVAAVQVWDPAAEPEPVGYIKRVGT